MIKAASIGIALLLTLGCTSKSPGVRSFSEIYGGTALLRVTTSSFPAGGKIPDRYAANGASVSPSLAWAGAPAGTKAFVIVVEDPDAPSPEPFVHWTVVDLPPQVTSIPEAPHEDATKPAFLKGGRQGANDGGSGRGYFGPRPPIGDPPHHYHFTVLALDTTAGVEGLRSRARLLAATRKHVLACGDVVGTFQQK